MSRKLHQLIQGLSRSERKYFHIHANKITGSKNYVRLFEILEKQNVYNDKLARKEMKVNPNAYAVTKHYLYRVLLENLVALHQHDSAEHEIRFLLSSMRILNDRGMPELALDALDKAKAIAEDLESFIELIDIQRWQSLLRTFLFREIKEDQDEEKYHLARLEEYQHLKFLYTQLIKLRGNKIVVRNKTESKRIQATLYHPLIAKHNQLMSISAKVYAYRILVVSEMFLGNNAQARKHNESLQNTLLPKIETTKNTQKYLDWYLGSLVDQQSILWGLGDAKSAIRTSDTMNLLRLKTNFPAYKAIMFTQAGIFRLLHQLKQKNRTSMLHDLETFEHEYISERPRLVMTEKIFTDYICAYLNFCLARYKQANQYINRIIEISDQKITNNIYGDVYWLRLVIHYELNKIELLGSSIRSLYRFLLRQGNLFPLERSVLSFLRKIINTTDEAQIKKLFLDQLASVQQLQDDQVKGVFMYFDFKIWLISKTQKISMLDAFKQ